MTDPYSVRSDSSDSNSEDERPTSLKTAITGLSDTEDEDSSSQCNFSSNTPSNVARANKPTFHSKFRLTGSAKVRALRHAIPSHIN
jgi:hypothetical protein